MYEEVNLTRWSPSSLALLPAAVWRLLFEDSLPQRRCCLCSSSALPRSGCAQVPHRCFMFFGQPSSSMSSLTTRIYTGTHQGSQCEPQLCGAVCLKPLYLSNDVASSLLLPRLAPDVRRCRVLALCLERPTSRSAAKVILEAGVSALGYMGSAL